MNDTLRAAQALIDVLAQENAALAALDFPAALRWLGPKQAAITALTEAQARSLAHGPLISAEAAQIARTLGATADHNRVLLERALAVQGRVIGVLAQAARQSSQPGRYAAGGRFAAHRTPPPFAVAARV